MTVKEAKRLLNRLPEDVEFEIFLPDAEAQEVSRRHVVDIIHVPETNTVMAEAGEVVPC